ncbi:uroporphyrinogen-III synthase [Pseudotabrizicola algicola]|uniref:Uroporphyrinogen-III synthase n=1 Tax=Pseudotabrizicola algicola TaxID=2709381 RepID=A0A6B3RPT8_9RHOB|nr:uroporphyrinogen-III synthase [Pseudotabrizicola algicola]NEX48130.1 uroporphyrinogen-III synthase [Pseudotabrizicola algicola]
MLITRPQPQASRFADAATERYGTRVRPVLSPLLAPSYFLPDLPKGPFGAVILTSETGAQAAAAMLGRLPARAYCVGERTAEVASGLGFSAQSADGNADDLLRLLLTRPEHAPFLHMRGREARGDLAARLQSAGVPAQEVIVYAQEPQPLSSEARGVLEASGDVIAPLFSPRSAEVFRRALADVAEGADLWPRLCIAALSPAIASIFADCPARQMIVATGPTQAELFSALDRFIFTA